MIISNKQVQNVLKVYSEQTKVSKNTKSEKNNMVQKKDEVILSSNAQEFGHILEKLRQIPEVREQKVQEISKKIENGTYKVSSAEIADKML